MSRDEFYIGYEADVPSGVATRVRVVVAALVGGVPVLALVALAVHARLQPSRFDFGRPHAVQGMLRRAPYPAIDLPDRRVWLVGQGKHGAEAALGTVPDGGVRLEGTTIARGEHEMLEVVPGSVVPDGSTSMPATRSSRGRGDGAPEAGTHDEEVTLTGEIVDSKCFLGVMNPGEGTVHRDCARMCLRGGIPPMLLVESESGHDALVHLVSSAGEPIGTALAHLAGQSVTVTGRLDRRASLPVLSADAAAFELYTARRSGPRPLLAARGPRKTATIVESPPADRASVIVFPGRPSPQAAVPLGHQVGAGTEQQLARGHDVHPVIASRRHPSGDRPRLRVDLQQPAR